MFTKVLLGMSYSEPVSALRASAIIALYKSGFHAPLEAPRRIFRLGGWLAKPELVLFFAAQALFPVARTDDGLIDFDNRSLMIHQPELLGNVLLDLRESNYEFIARGGFEGELEQMFALHHAYLRKHCAGFPFNPYDPRNTANPFNGAIIPRSECPPPDEATVAATLARMQASEAGAAPTPKAARAV